MTVMTTMMISSGGLGLTGRWWGRCRWPGLTMQSPPSDWTMRPSSSVNDWLRNYSHYKTISVSNKLASKRHTNKKQAGPELSWAKLRQGLGFYFN